MSSMHDPIRVDFEDGCAVVRPSGEVDVAMAGPLRAALESVLCHRPSRVVVVLRDVQFLDSSGLAALVHGWRVAGRQGVGFAVVEPTDQVRRLLAITGLDQLLDPE